MKKIKILALIAIVVFVVQNVGEAVQNLVYGEPEPTQSKLYTDSYDSHLKLAVRPTDTCVPGNGAQHRHRHRRAPSGPPG